jgi:hypothetical protein
MIRMNAVMHNVRRASNCDFDQVVHTVYDIPDDAIRPRDFYIGGQLYRLIINDGRCIQKLVFFIVSRLFLNQVGQE